LMDRRLARVTNATVIPIRLCGRRLRGKGFLAF
jgi:hypothetical protein